MGIEKDASGDAGDYGESGEIEPGGLDLDLSGRGTCGDGSDGDGGADGSTGLEADSRAASEDKGDNGSVGAAPAPAAAGEPLWGSKSQRRRARRIKKRLR